MIQVAAMITSSSSFPLDRRRLLALLLVVLPLAHGHGIIIIIAIYFSVLARSNVPVSLLSHEFGVTYPP